MARKKHQFHCNLCHSACEIYKKGRKHRVLVCPHCGVLATNPGLGALIGGAVGSIIPGAGTAAGAALGGLAEGAISHFTSRRREPARVDSSNPSAPHPGRLTNFQKAIALEALER